MSFTPFTPVVDSHGRWWLRGPSENSRGGRGGAERGARAVVFLVLRDVEVLLVAVHLVLLDLSLHPLLLGHAHVKQLRGDVVIVALRRQSCRVSQLREARPRKLLCGTLTNAWYSMSKCGIALIAVSTSSICASLNVRRIAARSSAVFSMNCLVLKTCARRGGAAP